MNPQLPFFNFSLKKVLDGQPDFFERAKIKIIITILIFSIVKALLVFPVAIAHHQDRQLIRAFIIAILFLLLIKILLYRPETIKTISHIILIAGVAVIFSNLFVYSQELNTLTVQLIFMTSLCSYYLIGGKPAAVYTALSIFLALVYMVAGYFNFKMLPIAPERLPALGMDAIVMLNFMTFVISHYLYYRAFHQNLKEKDALNQQLQHNVTEAKALAHSRSIFLSTMLHELRTPLNGVIGMASLLRDNAVDGQKDYLDIIEFSAGNLLSLINDVLDYNKSELDKIELEMVPVNIAVLMQKISAGLRIKAVEKNLLLQLELDETLIAQKVIADPTRLTQIIYNLAGNAIKFTEKGSVKISVKVLSKQEHEARIEFAVTDTGIGISAGRQEAIFDIFTQASSDTTRKYGGTGLGLAIVKRLLKLFGSEIQLKSAPGEGAVFSFAVSLTLYHGDTGGVISPAGKKSIVRGLKILIVEDNHINVLILKKLLAKWEIACVVAVNGQDAVEKLSNQSFDGVLMDIHMPVMDGYAATTAIRAMADPVKANIPVFALTASVSHNIHAKIKSAGMQDYLAKPFQPDDLYEKLQRLNKLPH